MNTLVNLLIGIAGSLIASIIFVIVAPFFSARMRWLMIAILSRICGVDLDYVYKNPEAAAADIMSDLKNTRRADLLTSRGHELCRPTFSCLLSQRPGDHTGRFRILLPETRKDGSEDWLQQRHEELAVFDKSFEANDMLRVQVKSVTMFVVPHVLENRVEVRTYNQPHIARILLTDKFAYFTPYRLNAHGRESRVYKFRRGDDMYDCLDRWFNICWEHGRPIQSNDDI